MKKKLVIGLLLLSSVSLVQAEVASSKFVAAKTPAQKHSDRLMLDWQNPSSDEQSAFHSTVQQAFPMSPQQIKDLKRIYDESQKAAAASPNTPPAPVLTSLQVSLAPSAVPPVVRLARGFVTSLVFVDSSGAAWPIKAYDMGNPSAFNVKWSNESDTLMVQALTPYTYGNLAILLKGLDTPVMVTLIPGQSHVDYRVDLHIAGMGPNSKPSFGDSLPTAANPALLSVLNGVPPEKGKSLKVTGAPLQAWLAGKKLFVRTRLTVLSPGWSSTMSSADGTHAYELPRASQILLADHGKQVSAKLEGF